MPHFVYSLSLLLTLPLQYIGAALLSCPFLAASLSLSVSVVVAVSVAVSVSSLSSSVCLCVSWPLRRPICTSFPVHSVDRQSWLMTQSRDYRWISGLPDSRRSLSGPWPAPSASSAVTLCRRAALSRRTLPVKRVGSRCTRVSRIQRR